MPLRLLSGFQSLQDILAGAGAGHIDGLSLRRTDSYKDRLVYFVVVRIIASEAQEARD